MAITEATAKAVRMRDMTCRLCGREEFAEERGRFGGMP